MDNISVRVATILERMYSYNQSTQIQGQTGCIGHLRADLDTDGNGFFSSWWDHRSHLKTDEFKEEFDEVVNFLRFNEQYGGILKNRRNLASFCYEHPASSFGNGREYGFRADTDKYAYIIRLNPNKGDYNMYCYCYRKDWLDQHLKNAEHGIRFIDSSYNQKFKLPDGEKIKIVTPAGSEQTDTCRYIDDYHLEIGNNIYHICEFAERMEEAGNTVIPLCSFSDKENESFQYSQARPILRNFHSKIGELDDMKTALTNLVKCGDILHDKKRNSEYWNAIDDLGSIYVELIAAFGGKSVSPSDSVILDLSKATTDKVTSDLAKTVEACYPYVDSNL